MTGLAVNQDISLPPVTSFEWVQRGPGSLQLLGVFTRFVKKMEKNKQNNWIQLKNVVNSLWTLDWETFQWSCLNSGAAETVVVDLIIVVPLTDELNGLMKEVKSLSLTQMTIFATAKGLVILPQENIKVTGKANPF